MNRARSLRNNRLGFENSGNLPIVWEGIYRIYLHSVKEDPKPVDIPPTGLGDTRISTDHAQNLPGHCPGSSREVTGHNHLDTLFSGPSDHEDRRPRWRSMRRRGAMLCYVEGVLFPNPITSPHASNGYEVINLLYIIQFIMSSFDLTVEGPVKLCKSLSLLVAWALWCTVDGEPSTKLLRDGKSVHWSSCSSVFSIIKKTLASIDWTLRMLASSGLSVCVWSVVARHEFYIGFILNVCNHGNRSHYIKYCIYFHTVLYVNVQLFF